MAYVLLNPVVTGLATPASGLEGVRGGMAAGAGDGSRQADDKPVQPFAEQLRDRSAAARAAEKRAAAQQHTRPMPFKEGGCRASEPPEDGVVAESAPLRDDALAAAEGDAATDASALGWAAPAVLPQAAPVPTGAPGGVPPEGGDAVSDAAEALLRLGAAAASGSPAHAAAAAAAAATAAATAQTAETAPGSKDPGAGAAGAAAAAELAKLARAGMRGPAPAPAEPSTRSDRPDRPDRRVTDPSTRTDAQDERAGLLALLSTKANVPMSSPQVPGNDIGPGPVPGPLLPTAVPAQLSAAQEAPAPAPPDAGFFGTHPSDAAFGPLLGERLSVLLRDGVHDARLRLHPAELGPIHLQITLDGAAAQVHLAAEHPLTRQALDAAMPSLAASLHEAGLTLTGGGVSEQPQQQPDGAAGRAGSDGSSAGGAGRGTAGRSGNTDTPDAGAVDTAALRHRGALQRGLVDLVA